MVKLQMNIATGLESELGRELCKFCPQSMARAVESGHLFY